VPNFIRMDWVLWTILQKHFRVFFRFTVHVWILCCLQWFNDSVVVKLRFNISLHIELAFSVF